MDARKLYIAGMPGYLIPLLMLAMLATLGVLLFGVLTMARGGEFNRRNANKLMRVRVILQGVALLILVIVMALASRG